MSEGACSAEGDDGDRQRCSYVPWSSEEDERLRKLVEEHGARHWTTIAQWMPNRNSKSCRLRWVNQLRDDLKKGGFTPEEDEAIIKGHIKHGNRWTLIAKDLPGRTDNAVKNRWHSTLRKRVSQQAELRQQLLSAAGIAEMALQPEAAQLLTYLASTIQQSPQEAAQLQALLTSMSPGNNAALGSLPSSSLACMAAPETTVPELLGSLASRAGLDPASFSSASTQLQEVLQRAGMLMPTPPEPAPSAAPADSSAAGPMMMPPPPPSIGLHSASFPDLFVMQVGGAGAPDHAAAAPSVNSSDRADSNGQYLSSKPTGDAEDLTAFTSHRAGRHAPRRQRSSGSSTIGGTASKPAASASAETDVAAAAAGAAVSASEAVAAGAMAPPGDMAALLHSLTPEQLMWMARMKQAQASSVTAAAAMQPPDVMPAPAPSTDAAAVPPTRRKRDRKAAAADQPASSSVASESTKRHRMRHSGSDAAMLTHAASMDSIQCAAPFDASAAAVPELLQQQAMAANMAQLQMMGMHAGAAGMMGPLPHIQQQLVAGDPMQPSMLTQLASVGLQAIMAAQQQQAQQVMAAQQAMQTNMLQNYLQRVADQQAAAPSAPRPPSIAPSTDAAAEAAAAINAAAAAKPAEAATAAMELPSDHQLAQLCWDAEASEFMSFGMGLNTPLGSLSDLTALIPADKACETPVPMAIENDTAKAAEDGLLQSLFNDSPIVPTAVAAPMPASCRGSTCGDGPSFSMPRAPASVASTPAQPVPQVCASEPAFGGFIPAQPAPLCAAPQPALPALAPPPPPLFEPAAAAEPQSKRSGSCRNSMDLPAPAPKSAVVATTTTEEQPQPVRRSFEFKLPGASGVPFTAATAFMMGTITPASSSSTATSASAADAWALPSTAKSAPPTGNTAADTFTFCMPSAAATMQLPSNFTTTTTTKQLGGAFDQATQQAIRPGAAAVTAVTTIGAAGVGKGFGGLPHSSMASLLMGRSFHKASPAAQQQPGGGAVRAASSSCSSNCDDEEVPEWLAKAACPEPLGLGSMFEPLMMTNVIASAASSATTAGV